MLKWDKKCQQDFVTCVNLKIKTNNTNLSCVNKVWMFSCFPAFNYNWGGFLSHFTCSESPAWGQQQPPDLINPISSVLPQVHQSNVRVNNPRAENQKRNWQEKGALKSVPSSARRRHSSSFFFSITLRAPCQEYVWSEMSWMVSTPQRSHDEKY